MFKHIRNRADWSDKSVSQKGFTLIELLVVIAILGILAVVGVLSFGGLTGNARHATATTELTEVQSAVDAYMANGSTNPTGVAPADTASLIGHELKTGTVLQCAYVIAADGSVTFAASNVTATTGCPTSGVK